MAETVVHFRSDPTPTMDGCVDTGCDVSLNGSDEVVDVLRSPVITSGGGSSGSASLSSCSSHETVVSVGVRQPETRDHLCDVTSPSEWDQKPEPETVCCNGGDQSAESGDEVFHSEMTVMSPLVNRWRRRQQAEVENNCTSGLYLGWSNRSGSGLLSDPRYTEANSESRRGRSTHGYSSDTEAFLRTLNRRGTTSGTSVTVSGRPGGQSPSFEYPTWHRDWPANLHGSSSPASTIRQLEVCFLSLN